MKTAEFTGFIPQNIAPPNAKRICVYDSNNKKVASFGLQNLELPILGTKLYSAGLLSDVHVSSSVDTSEEDFRRALTFFQDVEKVDFVLIAGDLTQYAYTEEWELYAKCVSEESENIPVYPVGGNHDAYGDGLSDAKFQQYTGHGIFYTFTKGNDVYIMLSSGAWPSQSGSVQPFYTTTLQVLYETLEANRNKRCFVVQHYFPWGKSGDPFEVYGSNSAFWGTQGTLIYELMAHYKNAIWLHGHSHQTFETQLYHDKATYDFDFGCHSIHIPSCAKPVYVTDTSKTDKIEGSQGYVMDVYKNHIVLRGRDFVKEKFLPIATYCLDTTLVNVEANTFTDSTGTITT